MNEFQSLPTVNSCIISPGNLEGLQDVNNPIIKVEIKEEIEIKEAFDICTPGKEAYLTCFHCEEEFFNLIDLRTHIKKCHLLTAGCLLSACSRVSSTENQEGLQDTDNPIIKAEIKEEFDTFKDIFTYGEEAYFACFHCQEEFFNLRDLRIHIKKCHLEPVGCFSSKKMVGSKVSPSHSSIFTKAVDFKNIRRKIRLKLRKKGSIVKGKPFVKNDALPKRLSSIYFYFSPDVSCDPIAVLLCPLCEFPSDSPAEIVKHIKAVHKKYKPFDCPNCDCSTTQFGDLKRHFISKHTDQKEFACSYCPYSSSRKMVLSRHLIAQHSSELPLKDLKQASCPLCNYTTLRPDRIKSHIRAVHLGIRKDEKLKNSSNKTRMCPYCDFHSAYTSGLRRHVRAIHMLEKQYSCNMCDYSTAYYSEMKNHTIAKHTSLKPYKCSYCPYKTAYPKSVKRHIKTCH